MDHSRKLSRMKKELTDRTLLGLKSKHKAKAYDVMDSHVRGFGVRVMAAPSKTISFILRKRFPGHNNPVRRSIGSYPEMSLAEARKIAAEWNTLVKKGIDPAVETERQRKADDEAKKRQAENTVGRALDEYVARKLTGLKSGGIIERVLRRDFGHWADRPLTEISRDDVEDAILRIVDRGAKPQARTSFALLGGFLNWCVARRKIETSPHAKVSLNALAGKRKPRKRFLRDYELAAFWRASEAMGGYPWQPFYELLLLMPRRTDEVASARWREIDLKARLWVIPAERMKGAAAHAVPLTDAIIALLQGLPRFQGGDYIFSTLGGRRPISGFGKAKKRLDALMRTDLETQEKPFEPFQLRDVRRTVRTKFSALKIPQVVGELLLAHSRSELEQTYDLYDFLDEKREALELWQAKLMTIVTPPPDNVVQLHDSRETLAAAV
jgi:integrase